MIKACVAESGCKNKRGLHDCRQRFIETALGLFWIDPRELAVLRVIVTTASVLRYHLAMAHSVVDIFRKRKPESVLNWCFAAGGLRLVQPGWGE
jgi:hypothetical protein